MVNSLDSHSHVTQVESLLAGGMAGLLTRFCIAPFDLVKIRLQLKGQPILPTVSEVLKKEGITAFWKGNVPAEILYFAYSMAQFSTLQTVNHLLREWSPSDTSMSEQTRQLIAGGIGGSVASYTTYPFDYLRTRVAARQSNDKKSLISTVRNVWATNGIAGFYHGSTATVISIFPYMGLFFSSYSYFRDENAKYRPPSWMPEVFTASSLAALISKSAVYPLDTIRKRIQVHGDHSYKDAVAAGTSSGVRYSHNFAKCGYQIVSREGVRGLYRGLTVALVKAWPGSFLSVYFYEWSLKRLGESKSAIGLK